ncbi:MAG: cell division ATP-binding protein FtsE [Caldithrix sp.]|nr:cell division ATP-binding protein FtsE [Caldithrix sp.]
MIEFYNVTYGVDKTPILNNISLRIVKGEFVYLAGASGAGKSTVLSLIYMENLPDEGTVIIDRYSTAKIKQKEIPLLRRRVGVVFQDFRLLMDRTVFENVAFPLRVIGTKSKDIKRKVFRVLAEVNLSHVRNADPAKLSGGEKQRVAIARAVINNPFIVLADEPTGNLDDDSALEIMSIFEKINRQGTAVLMATHNQSLIQRFPHRNLYLNKGYLIKP